jgi:co-chaperonin GroES (HSP10)
MATGELDGYEVGDKVIYSQYAGEDVVIDNEKFVIIDSENIWGKRKGF